MKFSGDKFPQCRHPHAAEEGDGQPIAAAVYRSVRLFCYVMDKIR